MRCNVGVNPFYLTDQHLIAEYSEIPMIIGSLRYWNWEIRSTIPEYFKLGSGHMNFLKCKLSYLRKRHQQVKLEMKDRGFDSSLLTIDLTDIHNHFKGEYLPTIDATNLIRNRIKERLLAKPEFFWRYKRKKLNSTELNNIINMMMRSEVYYV